MTRFGTACALALALALSAVSSARAQVAVLRIDPEAEAVCRDIEAALQGVGVVDDPGYFSQAQEQGVDPASDGALELLTPLLQLKLAVVPMSVDDTSIEVEYRDGRTGARLGTARIPREQGKLGARGREQLRDDVVGHLGGVIEGDAPPAEDVGEEEIGAPRAIAASVRVGIGLGMHDVEWTRDGQTERVELGAFPAIDLGVSLSFRWSEGLSFVPALTYQSSMFFQEVEESRVAAAPESVGVRSHRFAATVGLEILLGGTGSVSISPALGLGVRNLRPEVHHLSTPAYSLAGPLAVLGVRLPLGDSVAARVAPEVQYLFVGQGLRERDVSSTALSLGAELSIALELWQPLALELAYREAHALLSSSDGRASDAERFITLRAVGTL
jgi:hypothetical protein